MSLILPHQRSENPKLTVPAAQAEWTLDLLGNQRGGDAAVDVDRVDGPIVLKFQGVDEAGGHQLIARSYIGLEADSVNLTTVYTGIGDGVVYPDSCMEECGG